MEDSRAPELKRLKISETRLNDPIYLQYKFLFRDLKNAIVTYGKGDVLDIGCGNKPYIELFGNRISSYVGCDIIQSSEGAVDILCPATDIPLPDNSKDTVFSTQVIEHVADHRKLLSEAYRILKPGGTLIISGPMAWEHHEEPYDFFRFTKYGLNWLLTEQGFTDIDIVANGGKWAAVGQLTLNSIRSSLRKKTPVRRVLNVFYFIFRIKWLINVLFSFLEKVDPDYGFTQNFVVTAKKN